MCEAIPDDGAYGWNALRLCVSDLETDGTIYSSMGKGVFKWLTRDEILQEGKRLIGIV